MNVYDFDGTLYRGESCLHFAFYCIIRKPKILLFLPEILRLYKDHKNNELNIEKANEVFKKILNTISTNEKELNEFIKSFWKKYDRKLNYDLIEKIKQKDIIISAGPDFLLKQSPIKDKNIFCSQIDLKKKKILFFCYGENKRKKFKEIFKE